MPKEESKVDVTHEEYAAAKDFLDGIEPLLSLAAKRTLHGTATDIVIAGLTALQQELTRVVAEVDADPAKGGKG